MEESIMKNSRAKSLRVAGKVIVALAIILTILWVRAFYGAMESYKKGEILLKKGETVRAITFFDRALHWYAPLNPYVEKAALKLWAIGENAEKTGDKRLALIAYDSIRNAFYGDTHFVTPGKNWIRKVDSKLASLRRNEAKKGEIQEPKILSGKSPYPAPFWSVMVVIGFLGWIGGLIGLIVGTFRLGGFRGGKGIVWLGFAVLCFILWIAGMVKA
jgi:hypothetical protein